MLEVDCKIESREEIVDGLTVVWIDSSSVNNHLCTYYHLLEQEKKLHRIIYFVLFISIEIINSVIKWVAMGVQKKKIVSM